MQNPLSPPVKIRVLCVDDNEDLPLILGRCIAAEADMESAGYLRSTDNLRAEVLRTRPDVVLLDMKIPGSDPLEALSDLLEPGPGGHESGTAQPVRVLAYSGRDDKAALDEARSAGACGYVSKDVEIPLVLEAIRAVARGDVTFRVWRATRRDR